MALTARWAVIADGGVADLAGRSGRPVVEVSVDEESAADAGADRDEQKMPCAASGTRLELRIPGGSGVMADDHRTLDPLREHRRSGDLVPAGHVGRVVHDAGTGIDRTRDADGESANVGVAGGLTGTVGHGIEHGSGTLLRRRIAMHGLAMGDVTDCDGGADAGAAEIAADQRRGHTGATESSQ